MNTSDILDKAADQIARYGWIQDDWYVPFGAWTECKVCAGGGIFASAGYVPDYDPQDGISAKVAQAFDSLAQRLYPNFVPEELDDSIGVVTAWNDEPDRTAGQVITELRAAAASEWEQGR